ncbi:MAG: ASKHA domain-containing protein [Clostridiales bacterium]|nr:ASKHA domain-containing protein [Clostridiales bacterium]
MRLLVHASAKEMVLEVQPGKNLLEALRENHLDLVAPCGGRGKCGKCRIQVQKGDLPVTDTDKRFLREEELKDGWRLACVAVAAEDLEIQLSSEKKLSIIKSYMNPREDTLQGAANDFTLCLVETAKIKDSVGFAGFVDALRKLFPGRTISLPAIRKCSGFLAEGEAFYQEAQFQVLLTQNEIVDILAGEQKPHPACGAAVDIGTTTIGLELVDLITGEKLASHAVINTQRQYGTDVVTRIQNAGEGKLTDLRDCVTKDILKGLNELVRQGGVEKNHVRRVAFSGNTTMMHLLLAIPCKSLGLFPFIPAVTGFLTLPFQDIFNSADFTCPATIMPGISTYVGSDITAGILFCGGLRREKPSLLIDLGTNGEMALFDGKRVLCTSTAAGPAFEGGNISCGVASIPGAICKTVYENASFIPETIGDIYPPVGICGSGVLDIGAQMVRHELIDETGLLEDENFDNGVPIAPDSNIYFTQKDVRELQLAKSAVRAGMEVLLQQAGVGYDAVEQVFLAGGFGFHVDLEHAGAIGLIPEELRDKVFVVGNSSLGGCVKILLEQDAEREIQDLIDVSEEINLSNDKSFNDMFMEYMYF